MKTLNGEPLPDLSAIKIVRRAKAGVPSVAEVRKALAGVRERPDRSSLAAARANAGFTQERFAAALGVPVSTYRQWEQGRRSLRGPARALVRLVAKHPDLIEELAPEG